MNENIKQEIRYEIDISIKLLNSPERDIVILNTVGRLNKILQLLDEDSNKDDVIIPKEKFEQILCGGFKAICQFYNFQNCLFCHDLDCVDNMFKYRIDLKDEK